MFQIAPSTNVLCSYVAISIPNVFGSSFLYSIVVDGLFPGNVAWGAILSISANNRPFYVLKNVKNFKRSDPKNCEIISMENYYYSFSKQKINVGSAWYCD